MKNKSIVLLVSLWMCMSLKAELIVDPTYDFSFEALFGGSGKVYQNISPKNRLIGLLNSILNPMLRITIKDLWYLNNEEDSVEGKNCNVKVRCLIEAENKAGTFLFDLEIYNAKTRDDVKETIISAFDAEIIRGEKPKTVTITFVDGVLEGYENDAVFFVRSHVRKYLRSNFCVKSSCPAIDKPLRIFVQLPLLISEFAQYPFAQNEWIKLLASRQKAFGSCKYVESGCYTIKSSGFQDDLVKNSIKVLKSLNRDKSAIFKANKAIQMKENLNLKIKKRTEVDCRQILVRAKKLLAKRDRELARQKELLTFLKNKIQDAEHKDLEKTSQLLRVFKKKENFRANKHPQKTSQKQTTTKRKRVSFCKASKVRCFEE